MYAAFDQQPQRFASVRMTIRAIGAPMESRNAMVQALAGVHKDIALDLKHLDEDLGANDCRSGCSQRCQGSSVLWRCCSPRLACTA